MSIGHAGDVSLRMLPSEDGPRAARAKLSWADDLLNAFVCPAPAVRPSANTHQADFRQASRLL